MISNILNDIITVIVPRLCFGCNARLYRGEHLLCTLCRNQIPLTDYDFALENPIDRIFYGRIEIEKAAVFLFYSEVGMVKNMIHYLKYKNQQQVGTFLGNWFGSILAEKGNLNNIDYIVPVPLHRKKQRKRGYNQVTEFARQLATHLNASYNDSILIKTANTKTQTKKSRIFRWQGNKELYTLTDTSFFKKKRVLLVDDVITTGATMEACAKAIQKSEGVTIYLAAMAAVP